MVGADASLLQSRQRLQALKDLGHYAGDVGAAWNDAATAALTKAQAALGVEADGKWGPATEDAIQKALQPSCAAGQCPAESAGPGGSATAGRLRVGGVIAGFAIASLTAAIAVTLRQRRPAAEETPP